MSYTNFKVQIGKPRMDVALFVTCLTDNFYPRTGIAVVRVLEALGCRVHFPEAQTCCGQPMWNNGYAAETREQARGMIRAFEGYDTVVTPSGSCAAMIRDYYPELFEAGDADYEGSRVLAGKTWEFVEFLVKGLMVDLRDHGVRWEGRVTYHYSCHLRGLGMTDEAERVLGQIAGLEYVPLEKKEQCCGFGGTFASNYPQVSGAMVEDKASCIAATEAEVLVSNDAGCTMNIAGYLNRQGSGVRTKSLAEIIAEGMGLMEREG